MFSKDLNLEGRPIDWTKLHWLKTPLADKSKEIVFRKASQMGVSTYCIIWLLWLSKTRQAPRGIIYWLPTDSAVGDFVNTKLDPFIAENDELSAATENPNLRFKSAQNQGLKFMYGTPTFWRGLTSKTKVKSISADAAVYDEFDEADPAQVTQARKRLSASEVKLTRDLSTPTIPDYGIDKRFQESDQCFYAFKCTSCSKHNILEHHFPKCFQQDINGDYYHVCAYCKKPLDVSQGRWVATESRSKIRGYNITQLYSPFVSPNEIMQEYNQTSFMGHFYNHVLGLPYISATDKVTREMVYALCDPIRSMPASYIKQTVMGVDVGSKLHYVILEVGKPYKMIACGEVVRFDELDTLMLKYNVVEAVLDALPETRLCREFVTRHRHKAWMCFYSEHQKGSYAFDEVERKVSVGRTESIDVGQNLIFNKQITFPQRSPMVDMFADHCAAIVKVPEENAETGEIKYCYRKLSADHLRHAFNYALIAASRRLHGSVASVFR